jgi:Trypsin
MRMENQAYWPGIAADRIVAIVAGLDTGKIQIGSGYLLSSGTVLTARHCTYDILTGRPAATLRAVRLSDGASVAAQAAAAALDIAVLRLSKDHPRASGAPLELPMFGRVSRDYPAELQGCEAVGFPLWQLDAATQHRRVAQVRGHIRTMEGREAGELVMRDPALADVTAPGDLTPGQQRPVSPWGGLSGALVFHAEFALGVVVRHEPWLGRAALTILPVERVIERARRGDPEAAQVTSELGLSSSTTLPLAAVPPEAGSAYRRLCLGVRAEGHPLPPDLADRLSWIMVAALSAAGVNPELCGRQDGLDGRHVITLPGDVHLASTVPAIVRAVGLAAEQANASSEATPRLRVTMTLAYGPVRPTAGGYTGPPVSAATGMLDYPPLRDQLRRRPTADLAVMIADDLYRLLCSQAPDSFSPADFRPASATVPGTPSGSQGWLYLPASDSAVIDPAPSAAGAQPVLALAALPAAGVALWLYTHHGAASPAPVPVSQAAADGAGADPYPHAGGHEWHVPMPVDGVGHGHETAHGASTDVSSDEAGGAHSHYADGGPAYLGGSGGEGLIGPDGSGAGWSG